MARKNGEFLTIRAPAELLEKLRAQAERDQRSIASMARILIERGLERSLFAVPVSRVAHELRSMLTSR
jgi:predicted DNA-binding protein